VEFDSHVWRLLGVTTSLVNALTPGLAGGRAVTVPEGSALRDAVADAVRTPDYRHEPSHAEAIAMAGLAVRARAVFAAVEEGDLPAAAALVNGLIEQTAPRPRLDGPAQGPFRLHFHGPDDSFEHGWAAGIAAGLALAIGSDLAGRLGVCRAPDCDRVFVDSSRNAGRRFCSARCQSRVKAAAHRARLRAQAH
jgi:hypothetical protein